jgi:hypothetical protein
LNGQFRQKPPGTNPIGQFNWFRLKIPWNWLTSQFSHNTFQVCLGFQPLVPIDIALIVASSPKKSSNTWTKEDHATKFVERIQHLQQEVSGTLGAPSASSKARRVVN